MKHKKLYATLMAVALPAGMALTGCGNDDSSVGSPSPAASSAASPAASAAATKAPSAADLKPVELSIYYPGGTEQKDQTLVEAELNKLLKDKINATVKIFPVDWGSWTQKMNLMVAGNEPFDLVYTAGSDNYSGKVAAGSFMDLTSLIDQYGQELKKNIDPLLLEGTKINGKNYSVPVQKEIAASQGLFINKSFVDKYGFDISKIKTLKDLEPMLQTIKEKEPATVVPFWATTNVTALLPYEVVGAKQIPGVIDRNGGTKVINQWETPEAKELFQLMHSWNTKGYFQKDPTTQTDSTAYKKAGTLFSTHSSLKPGADKESSAGLNYEWVQVELLSPYVAANGLTGAMTSISRTSKNPERAMMLINLLHTDKQVLNTLVWGIEGTHYTKTGDNIIKKTDASNSYNPGINWKFGNQFLNYLWENEDPKKWDNFKTFNKNAQISKILGFTYDAEPVKNEESAIVNLYKPYVDAMSAGVLDPEKGISEYSDKLKKAGLDKVLAEKQKQVDAFIKTQTK
ncbi:MAG: sugar transporter substrate-binding protein [Paenibacillaceae bacterium]|jgi:putative aldouronate transport system substrate-binding protein|nr:sugar transporter substrate-binding protein [Paenibacillaceae bacterium]